ncbi:hypothetical protein Bbelb_299000 [Branchiostoma belcheri]|nr:hypothetical protein Bbelb_299000 [Branchiostoma belcheri]
MARASMGKALFRQAENDVYLHIPGDQATQPYIYANDDPSTHPSANDDPSTKPSANDDPSTKLSANDDPSTKLSANDDPSTKLSANDDPSTQPSANDDPSTHSSANDDPSTHSSANDDPSTKLSANDDPSTHPSANDDPSTKPSADDDPKLVLEHGRDAARYQRDDDDDGDDVTAKRGKLAAGNGLKIECSWCQVVVAVLTVGIIVALTVGGITMTVGGIFAVKSSMGDAQLLPPTVETVSTTGVPSCSTAVTTMTDKNFSVSSVKAPPTLRANPPNLQEMDGRILEMITFGGKGREPGKFEHNYGVAVSADNKIFITDWFNNRIQIFDMNGTYLRLFPTVVPGGSRELFPYSLAFDVDPGYLWVLGSKTYAIKKGGYVVQYSREGQPIKKFDVQFNFMSSLSEPVIAVDARHNKVIVAEGDTIMMFHPNGSLYRSLKGLVPKASTVVKIGGVALDRDGNITFTDSNKSIKKYSHSGVKIFEFGIFGRNKGQLGFPIGVCVDAFSRIIVANRYNNRVDMFTRRGEFVRTVADIKGPFGIALGPDGDLVVTSLCETCNNIVSIVPRNMVLP